ncbi:MAG: thiamine pyrophosphate-dependent enzyme [Thaumarchaeota archaeon]|jgi:2-oxoglutarate ferredoxin oxidoreductase subunit beta|nr:thiamine pyrophosphate-dependent enzyme [Candidatus Geocrenenecus arthurdayi]
MDVFERAKPRWCPGCGDFSVYEALKNAFIELGLRPEEIVIVCGIGCATFIWSYINTNALKGIHGRVLPAATGVKLANPGLKVIGVSGDGDAYSIGGNHLVHTARRNVEITYIVVDNGVFGNTRGQPSPTTPIYSVVKNYPFRWPEKPVNPLLLALVSGATFVAQGFVGDVKKLKEYFKEAIIHRGFSFINILSVCPTFNPTRTVRELKEEIVYVEEFGAPLDNVRDAVDLVLSIQGEGKKPVGVIYKKLEPTYNELLKATGKLDPSINYDRINEIAERELGLKMLIKD